VNRWLKYGLLLGLLLLLASPLLSVIWSDWFATRHGCTLHEGNVNSCIVRGADWGETLYTAFVLGWLMLITIPLAAVVVIVLLVIAIRDIVAFRRSKG